MYRVWCSIQYRLGVTNFEFLCKSDVDPDLQASVINIGALEPVCRNTEDPDLRMWFPFHGYLRHWFGFFRV